MYLVYQSVHVIKAQNISAPTLWPLALRKGTFEQLSYVGMTYREAMNGSYILAKRPH